MNATSGSYFACCLPPNPPPGSGATIRTFDSGRRTRSAMTLEPVRVLDRAPDHDPVAVGAAMNACGSIANWVTIREGVCALDDDVGFAFGRLEVAPFVAVLAGTFVPASGSSAGRGSWTSGASAARAAATVWTAELLDVNPHQPRGLFGRIERLGRDRGTGSPWNFVSPVADGPVTELGPNRGIGSGRSAAVARAERRATAAALVSIRRSAPCDVERDELHVQDVLEVDVGDVLLPPGDSLDPTDARRRLADRHWGATSASGVDDRSSTSGAAGRACPRRRLRRCRLEDLLVAGTAAVVAGQAFFDVRARRCGTRSSSACAETS